MLCCKMLMNFVNILLPHHLHWLGRFFFGSPLLLFISQAQFLERKFIIVLVTFKSFKLSSNIHTLCFACRPVCIEVANVSHSLLLSYNLKSPLSSCFYVGCVNIFLSCKLICCDIPESLNVVLIFI